MLGWLLKGLARKEPPSLEAGLQHHREGRLGEAEAVYRAVLAAEPANVNALHFAGVVAYQQGRHREAAALIVAALDHDGSNAPAHNNLGNVYAAEARIDEAIACYRRAVELDPGYVDALVNLAAKLKGQGHLDEAAVFYRKALALAPEHAMALTNLGGIHNDQARPQQAVECCRKAIALKPGLAEAHNNLGNALGSLGQRAEAEATFRQALALKPDMAAASLNYAFLLLLRGDYAAGLPLLEKRFEAAVSLQVHLGLRDLVAEFDEAARWNGEPAQGKRLLVWSDQGLGDSIMMLRYLPLLKARGFARVLVYCEPGLMRMMTGTQGVDQVISKQSPVPYGQFDVHCPVMSLPLAFRTGLESIPRQVPYISVPPAMKQAWSTRLAELPGRRIGIAWAGTPLNPKNGLRSIALEALAPLFQVPGTRFVNLQKGDAAEALAAARWPLRDWMSECHDLLDTAALISELDLVISVDTSVAHLAGALGKPVWMFNRFESEWRWMLEREDSPWYPSMRIFRQPAVGDWSEPIARMAAQLRA